MKKLLENPLKDIEQYTQHDNIAEILSEKDLASIGDDLGAKIELDENSRSKWQEDYDNWMTLAQQIVEPKSYPWRGASNVKFPLLTIAAIQFHARAFAALIPSRELVKQKEIGTSTDEKKKRGRRVGKFMSAQFLDMIPNWEDGFDRLLMLLPIVGLVYRKTYEADILGGVRSDMVQARDVIVNYHAKDYNRARITHRLYQDTNEVYEYVESGMYLDVDLGDPTVIELPGTRDKGQGLSAPGTDDDLTPYEIFESHCWMDLDDDGYKEPYIVTLEKNSRKVLRIVARWDEETAVRRNTKNKVVRIAATNHWTAYKFLPDPESETHGVAFGKLLGPTNDSVDTIINMLIDSGHMSSLSSGFLSKGVRIKGGSISFRPNEFKSVQFTGDDIRKGIFTLPVKEPSNVLFQLLGLLINAGQDLTSVQDVMVGRNPGQNQPYLTTEKVIEQGLKVFNGIYKRIYRSLTSEFKKVYRINYYNLADEEYVDVLDDAEAVAINDFALDGFDIMPTASPDMVQEATKVMRGLSLKQHAMDGAPLNIEVVTRRVLEAEGHTEEEIAEVMTVPEPEPTLDELNYKLEVAKFQHEQKLDYVRLQLDVLKTQEQALRDRAYSISQLKKAEQGDIKLAMDSDKLVFDQINTETTQLIESAKVVNDAIKNLQQDNQQQQQSDTT